LNFEFFEGSGPVDPEFISMSCQTDFLPSTPFGETDAIRLAFEARISGLQETGLLDKQNYEQSLSDFQQQVDRLKQKSLADKRFIDELSSDRESDREEMLKLTQTVEDAWRESERQTEKMALLQQTVGELETQLQTFSAHNSSLIITRTRLEEDLQAKNEHLRQREDLLNELERQLAERDSQASHHQKQLERLKMDLSGFLHSPPQSPEPSSNECNFN
jgi:chromosome segregation ATPase